MKTTLLASSPTLDGIKAVIAKFYYGEKELLSKCKRYRFESIN